jgi:hypothetical protein
MAKFIQLRIPGEQTPAVYVNVDQVRVLRPGSAGRTVVIFDDNHSVSVIESAEHVAALAGSE